MSIPTNKDKLVHFRVILKSGAEFTMIAEKATVQYNGLGDLTKFNYEGAVENAPMYLNFDEVAAIIRVLSNEERGESKDA